MGRFREQLAASAPDPTGDGEPASTAAPEPPVTRDTSPFSMEYDTGSFALDAETTDQMLTVLVAATNLM